MDALVVKIHDQGRVQNHHAYLAVGINDLGVKDVLGLWITKGEGAKQWLSILTELKNRGIEDVLVCCVDGLKGFPDAIEAIWPETLALPADPPTDRTLGTTKPLLARRHRRPRRPLPGPHLSLKPRVHRNADRPPLTGRASPRPRRR